MEHSSWLTTSLVYLGAAVLAVPLARALGLGSIIGYLAAGIAIGPWGLRLVTDAQQILHFAEFGVVLMLFLVGLELEPRRLWALRKPIFGWGSFQLFGSAGLMIGIALLAAMLMAWSSLDWRIATVAALGLGLSSTAIGLGALAERNLMSTTSGQSVLSVALLQDVAAIPILALIPLMVVGAGAGNGGGAGWLGAAKAVGVIATIVFGGRLLLRPALRWVAACSSCSAGKLIRRATTNSSDAAVKISGVRLRAIPGAALSPAHADPARRDRAALEGRGQTDRRIERGPAPARIAVCTGARSGSATRRPVG